MRTREKSKAQLLEQLKELQEQHKVTESRLRAMVTKNTLLTERNKAAADPAYVKNLVQELDKLKATLKETKDLHESYGALVEVKAGLESQVQEQKARIDDLMMDRDHYRRKWSEASAECDQAKRALVTLAQSTGRIGKADPVSHMSMTDQSR